MSYLVEILVMKRESVLDAEAKAIKNALESMGFEGILDVSYGRSYSYRTDVKTEENARIQVEDICNKYLVNSVNERYEIVSIEEVKE